MRDKILHIAISAIMAFAIGELAYQMTDHNYVWSSVIIGLISAMYGGFAKEFADMSTPGIKWDWNVILADAVGAVAGCILIILIALAKG